MITSVIIYGLAFGISLVLCYIYEKKIDKSVLKNRIGWTLLIILPTVFISAIRYNVGIDFLAYESDFYKDKLAEGFDYFIKEPLNFLINVVTYMICPNSVAIFTVYSFIVMFVFFRAIDYYRDRISLTLSLFIFYMTYYLPTYSVIRQMIAVIIILYASRYIFEKRFWKYLICVALAGMIHKTAWLMIILYFFNNDNLAFLKKIKIFNKIKIKENIKSILVYIVIGVLPLMLIPIIPKLISALGIYSSYLSKETQISFKFLLYVVPILVLIFVYRKKLLQENYKNEFFIRMLILQIPFQLMGGIIKYIDRFSLYPAIMQTIIVSILYKKLNNKGIERLTKVAIIGWYIFYFIVMFVILNSNGVMPYTTIFSK
jgi:hypothetical protein